jgi:hypothetical protein
MVDSFLCDIAFCMKMTAFLDMVPCSCMEVDTCLDVGGSMHLTNTTRQYIPEVLSPS